MVSFSDGTKRSLDLRNFKLKNAFSKQFKEKLGSREAFVKKFLQVVKKSVPRNVSFSESEQSDESVNTVSCSESEQSDQSVNTDANEDATGAAATNGKYVLVHVQNLLKPDQNRAVRPLNTKHVLGLEESFSRAPSQDKALVGLLVRGNIEKAAEPGACGIQVLGGNHTRAALQSLYEKGVWSSTVNVRVLQGLTAEECLRVGVLHNEVDQQALAMSFMDNVRVIRQLRERHGKAARQKATTVFNLQTTTQFRHNYRTHEEVAKLPDEVWQLVCRVETEWREKKPLRQTFFKRWTVVKDSRRKAALLSAYLDSGMASFQQELSKQLGMVKAPAEDGNGTDIETDIVDDAADDSSVMKRLRAENKNLKKSIKTKDAEIARLNSEIERYSRERLTDDDTDMNSDGRDPDQQERLTDDDTDMNSDGRDPDQQDDIGGDAVSVDVGTNSDKTDNNTYVSDGDEATGSSDSEVLAEQQPNADEDHHVRKTTGNLPEISRKGERTKKSESHFVIGEKVWAMWRDGSFYPAKIMRRLYNGFKVKFTEDGVIKNVKTNEIRKS